MAKIHKDRFCVMFYERQLLSRVWSHAAVPPLPKVHNPFSPILPPLNPPAIDLPSTPRRWQYSTQCSKHNESGNELNKWRRSFCVENGSLDIVLDVVLPILC